MGVKISNLPAIVSPALSDVFPVVQSGVTYKETLTQLSALLGASGVNSSITSMTGLTGVLQAPTFINDANSNHVVGFTSVASAINYFTLSNSNSGVPLIMAALGGDANIQLDILSKGTGSVALGSAGATSQIVMFSGTAYQHITNWNLPTSANTRTLTLPDSDGTIAFTGTLVTGNLVKASSAFAVADQGFAIKSVAGAAAAGGSASQSFTDAFCTTGSNVVGNWNTQANAVSVFKIVPGNGSFVVTSSGDAGVGTFNYIITK